jgi:RHO1 GDP-GTP exchange protein 1/2
MDETVIEDADADALRDAIHAFKIIQSDAQLLAFQSTMGKGVDRRLEWHHLVSNEVKSSMSKQEATRQRFVCTIICLLSGITKSHAT